MLARLSLAVLLLISTNSAFAKDVYLSIGGQVNNFFTDARIFNPSFDKDIVVNARFLQNNQNNSGVAAVPVNVPKRTMVVLDNVVSEVFQASGIGAVRLTSDDDFVATQRIYANVDSKTLGQFVPGLDATTALSKGVLIQLQQNGTGGQVGTFRTNLGGANPNGAVASITLELHDQANAVAATRTFQLQPFGILTPSRIDAFFGTGAGVDLSDAWISFASDQPVFLYGSVIDNGSDDPTFVTASNDSGIAPPAPQIKNVTVVAVNWFFSVDGGEGLKAQDQVKFAISSAEDTHGFQLVGPNGENLINLGSFGATPEERTITLPAAGTYTYFCTFSLCGIGHSGMSGQFTVDP
jgi:hypothetical protein